MDALYGGDSFEYAYHIHVLACFKHILNLAVTFKLNFVTFFAV